MKSGMRISDATVLAPSVGAYKRIYAIRWSLTSGIACIQSDIIHKFFLKAEYHLPYLRATASRPVVYRFIKQILQ